MAAVAAVTTMTTTGHEVIRSGALIEFAHPDVIEIKDTPVSVFDPLSQAAVNALRTKFKIEQRAILIARLQEMGVDLSKVPTTIPPPASGDEKEVPVTTASAEDKDNKDLPPLPVIPHTDDWLKVGTLTNPKIVSDEDGPKEWLKANGCTIVEDIQDPHEAPDGIGNKVVSVTIADDHECGKVRFFHFRPNEKFRAKWERKMKQIEKKRAAAPAKMVAKLREFNNMLPLPPRCFTCNKVGKLMPGASLPEQLIDCRCCRAAYCDGICQLLDWESKHKYECLFFNHHLSEPEERDDMVKQYPECMARRIKTSIQREEHRRKRDGALDELARSVSDKAATVVPKAEPAPSPMLISVATLPAVPKPVEESKKEEDAADDMPLIIEQYHNGFMLDAPSEVDDDISIPWIPIENDKEALRAYLKDVDMTDIAWLRKMPPAPGTTQDRIRCCARELVESDTVNAETKEVKRTKKVSAMAVFKFVIDPVAAKVRTDKEETEKKAETERKDALAKGYGARKPLDLPVVSSSPPPPPPGRKGRKERIRTDKEVKTARRGIGRVPKPNTKDAPGRDPENPLLVVDDNEITGLMKQLKMIIMKGRPYKDKQGRDCVAIMHRHDVSGSRAQYWYFCIAGAPKGPPITLRNEDPDAKQESVTLTSEERVATAKCMEEKAIKAMEQRMVEIERLKIEMEKAKALRAKQMAEIQAAHVATLP